MCLSTAIGLQDQFRSLQLIASIPPLVFLLLFKCYLNRRFANNFQYYLPEHQELSRAIIHSQESDAGHNKLEQRYCHPALKAKLLTPMIHSRALPLVRRLYKGKGNEEEKILTRGIGKKSQSVNNDEAVEGVAFTLAPEVRFLVSNLSNCVLLGSDKPELTDIFSGFS